MGLTWAEVKAATKSVSDSDVPGLICQVSPKGRSWILRYQLDGRRRMMGLGSIEDVSLATARDLARDARSLLTKGHDPIEHRKSLRAAQRLAEAQAVTFRAAAEAYIANHKASWRNAKHQWQWGKSLEDYVYPHIGSMAVGAIGVVDVRRVLEPIWLKMPDTAARIRGRIETVINAARADDESRWSNPARWERHKHAFPAIRKVRRVTHLPALPYAEVPAFMKQLAGLNTQSVSSMALRFTILCVSRTSETTGLKWPEINKKAQLWICPPERMKGNREHRTPLSGAAMAIIEEMDKVRMSSLVFPGWREKQPLSDMAMLQCLRRLRPGYTVHGFRSAFKDWCSERTAFPDFLSEMALAHVSGDKVRAAYARTDLMEKRRQLMEAWADFCSGS